jgi:hypothetical protein
MKEILNQGKISALFPDDQEGGGALSGEVHLIKHENKKYVVRICDDIKKAKYYEKISKQLQNKKIIPNFLGRYKNNVFYEFIEGRDLKQKEKLEVFLQLGKIGAYVNKLKTDVNVDREFYNVLRQLSTGRYIPSIKVLNRRKRSNIKTKPKKVFTKKSVKQIKELYLRLKLKSKAKVSLDISDFIPSNFRIRKGKVYLVDIEAIKPAIMGKGIAKGFLNYLHIKSRQNKFLEGYNSISSTNFLNKEYLNLCDLLFAIQATHFKIQVARNYNEDVKRINKLLNKYGIK